MWFTAAVAMIRSSGAPGGYPSGTVTGDCACLAIARIGQRLIEPDEVTQYGAFFDHLHAEAATGPDEAALIRSVVAELWCR